ncbi:unnamed protein product [Paramecium primaurelia]|uniref:Uncharacterized protein n=1 Tax=Paramecium primaurelia TaxID=5886 RepID=A0A8S1LF03_PARPR|nr:unnamed protein product [Paramecium primaurelia]
MSITRQNHRCMTSFKNVTFRSDYRQFSLSDPRRLEMIVKQFSVPYQPKGASLSKIKKKVEIQKYCNIDLRKRSITLEAVQSDRVQSKEESSSNNESTCQDKGTYKLMPQVQTQRQIKPSIQSQFLTKILKESNNKKITQPKFILKKNQVNVLTIQNK